MVKALVIEPSKSPRVVETPGQLSDLRELIGGGWLEAANGPDWHAYFDEEGGMKDLPLNVRASALLSELGATRGYLVGTVIFLGTGPEGTETDCPSHILDRA